MPHRREDQGLVEYIQSLEARIKRLEGGDKGVRQNDIRLGDMVVTTNAETNEICIENLVTGEKVCMGEHDTRPTEITFSWTGLVEEPSDTEDLYSPPFVVPADAIITEMVMSVQDAVTTSAITVQVQLRVRDSDGAVSATETFSKTGNAADFESPTSHPTFIRVSEDNEIYLYMASIPNDANGTLRHLTITVRWRYA